MLKNAYMVFVGLGALLVVPAVAVQGRSPASLREALAQTERALVVLSGLEQRMASGEAQGVAEALRATEPAGGDAQAQEARLQELRGQVALLQDTLDQLAPPGEARAPVEPLEPEAQVPSLTTGLDDAQRRLLGVREPAPALGAPTPEPARASPPAAAAAAQSAGQLDGAQPRLALEGESYTADALRLARVLYRQERHAEALALLDGREADPAAAYWKARCLEKLGRGAEALPLYEKVAADPAGGFESQRAREDVEFLRWRLRFEESAAKRTGGGQ